MIFLSLEVIFLEYNTRAIPKVSGLDILDNNIFYDLYGETYILYEF